MQERSDQSIVDRVRAARKNLWSKYDFDVDKVFSFIKEKENELRKEGVEFADDLKPSLPADFYNRLKALNGEEDLSAA